MIHLENVSYRYKNGKQNVFSNVSFQFEKGNLYCITGPSGCGKSTLLSLMAGLDVLDTGEIYIENEPISKADRDRLRREKVTMIFQSFQLFPLLTAQENVSYPLEMSGIDHKIAMEKAAELLLSVGIKKEEQNRYPSKLSGGQQQRIAIARALATGARIILADEPTGNLDAENARRIMNILRDLTRNNGFCIIVVTHDMEIVKQADVVCSLTCNGILI